jgi:tRNA dimethylallyltransferase
MIPVIIIEGPTASGKTVLALQLAQHLETEIISADSRQVYKYLNIGTAKPTKAELKQVKHHLIDIIAPNESFNAGLFRSQALAIIKDLHSHGKIPIICGGTGLYIKSLLEGLFTTEMEDKQVRDDLKAELETKGLPALYEELTMVDPVVAASISNNDKQRILRALEVYRATGVPISEHWQQQQKQQELLPYRIFLDADRAELYKRIDARILTMLESGLPDEIKVILAKGYTWTDPGFDSVGYKEYRPFFENGQALQDCIALAQQHTRNYAKRQFTWYRNCPFDLKVVYSELDVASIKAKLKLKFETLDRG